MVYLAIKDNKVIHHTDLHAMYDIDGIENPVMEITEEEFEAADCMVRLINGEIVIGKTSAEIISENNRKRIAEIDTELDKIDRKSIRPERTISHAMANGETPPHDDVSKLDEFEKKVVALRQERASLNQSVSG